MRHAELVHRCFRCGYCKFPHDYYDINCPAYNKFRFETYSPGGRMWLIRAWLNGELQWSSRLAEIMYSCTTCKNCVENCTLKIKDYLVDIIIGAREEMVEQGLIPPAVRDYLKNIQIYGNPYKLPGEERGRWSEGTGLAKYRGEEYLLYIGCVGSYDERGKNMSISLAKLLFKTGVSVGILGEEEVCDGNEARVLGESYLFEYLAEINTEKFNELGAQKIITLSPHSYNIIKNEYPGTGTNFTVYHYTQLLWKLIAGGNIVLHDTPVNITYHDPCYLGRYNSEYEIPRKILRSIPGVNIYEMPRNKENSFCCGGGGGNFFTDIIGSGQESPASIRIREALDTGAGTIVTACPICAKMLEDAVKNEGVEDEINVSDISELICMSMKIQ